MLGKTGVAIRESLEGELYPSSTFGVLKVKEGERDSEGRLANYQPFVQHLPGARTQVMRSTLTVEGWDRKTQEYLVCVQQRNESPLRAPSQEWI